MAVGGHRSGAWRRLGSERLGWPRHAAARDDEEPGDRKPDHGGGRDEGGSEVLEGDRKPMADQPTSQLRRQPRPTPTRALTIADFGPAPIGVPNFVIDQFTIPPFLLPIYQACGTQYGIPWQVLASINRIETAFGTNLNVSTAGALGWMQFMPSTWETYGVDANDDGRKDPYNPVDAICAAARYLQGRRRRGATCGRAIFAYNHADWYVDEVLLYARQYGKPARRPGRLADRASPRAPTSRSPPTPATPTTSPSARRSRARSPASASAGNAADVISGSPTRRGIDIFSREGAPVVAVNDGVITKIGKSKQLGRYIVLRDAYGNRFTYAQLGEVAKVYPVPKQDELTADDFKLVTPGDGDPQPTEPAPSAGSQADESRRQRRPPTRSEDESGPVNTEDSRARLFAYPERDEQRRARRPDRPARRAARQEAPRLRDLQVLLLRRPALRREDDGAAAAARGLEVIAGTVLGRVGKTDGERRAAPALRDPPGGPRRAEDRPEADPRRLEAARGDRDLPRRRQEPVRGRARPPARCC